MPSFKHKTNKKIVVDKKRILTLDGVHRDLQTEFSLIKNETLPSLAREKKEILQKLYDSSRTNNLDKYQKIKKK
jgi:hypothetical protein